jgi:hypothetical protein
VKLATDRIGFNCINYHETSPMWTMREFREKLEDYARVLNLVDADVMATTANDTTLRRHALRLLKDIKLYVAIMINDMPVSYEAMCDQLDPGRSRTANRINPRAPYVIETETYYDQNVSDELSEVELRVFDIILPRRPTPLLGCVGCGRIVTADDDYDTPVVKDLVKHK